MIKILFVLLLGGILAAKSMPGVSWDDPGSFLNPRVVPEVIKAREVGPDLPVAPAVETDDEGNPLFPYQDSDDLPQWHSSCPIPKSVFYAIAKNAPRDRMAWCAAVAKQESDWRSDCYHYDNDNGYAHGLFCIHSYWRAIDVERMGGRWEDPDINTQAFIRIIQDHENIWPDTKNNKRMAAARYNGGKTPNFDYADKVLAFEKQLTKWFIS